MSTAVFMHREVQIRQWFSMWLDKQDTGIGDLFAPDAVYIESWGPEYRGVGLSVRHDERYRPEL